MKLTTGILLAALTCTSALAQTRAAPEPESGRVAKSLVTAKRQMVVAANPLATKAGLEILRQGGSAADAAIATQLVLNLVEPQSSGIGGGAFALHWKQSTSELMSLDGRETAPSAARPTRFLQEETPILFPIAVKSGLSVGVPGLVRLLEQLHQRHGRLPWRELFLPAIDLAVHGFPVSERLSKLLSDISPQSFSPAARSYFYDEKGEPRQAGFILKNPHFAETLRTIAEAGSEAFYDGALAEAIVRSAKSAQTFPSDLSEEDLERYRAVEREPVCVLYRSHRICGMGPPSSGAITIGQALMMLERFDLGSDPLDTGALHLIAEAQKLAYADRGQYVADSDFVPVPRGLLARDYILARSGLIDPDRAAENVQPGLPPGLATRGYGRDGTREGAGTTHISVVDADGNAVALTSSIESAFGSGIWVAGFLLNNQLTDFAFAPSDEDGRVVANAVSPGKRPRSSMAPTLVFDPKGQLWAVLGSPGGSRIILYVMKAVIALVDWKLDAQQVADLANFGSRGGPFELEMDPVSPVASAAHHQGTAPAVAIGMQLAERGHTVRFAAMTSGLHIIVKRDGVLTGGADPRREGLALGD